MTFDELLEELRATNAEREELVIYLAVLRAMNVIRKLRISK